MGDADQPRGLSRMIPISVSVLSSGGLDSCTLVAELAREREVFPLYVEAGLAWEAEERRALDAFLAAIAGPRLRPLTVLSASARPIYGDHWSTTGHGVPGAGTEDAAVYLPGRNVILLALAAAWSATHGVHEIALGTLGHNPFPDATPAFFASFEAALGAGLAHEVRILAPYRGIHKEELIRRARDLPLEKTLTCIAPRGGVHCGRCNKCDERKKAFQAAQVPDRTAYAA